ncbi:Arb2 domain-containing protein [Macrophomina phaseolina]|uniref:Arb2 domain-containing protein n=1 Tax=Macrophomina phaseolina TaxID=35725 RepID=A0ABQ8GLC9_9PEZI|nr:Arb2 domain-containing protein [Macrophomina phaseolina]
MLSATSGSCNGGSCFLAKCSECMLVSGAAACLAPAAYGQILACSGACPFGYSSRTYRQTQAAPHPRSHLLPLQLADQRLNNRIATAAKMYRLTEAGMPEDPAYRANLKDLGFFIDERSEIRTIKSPHNYYNFWMSNNDRVNESFREAMHACINEEISHRMKALGIPPIYLPHVTAEKPTGEPSVPIFVTKKEELRKLKRIIVVINDDFQDLGMWAYRIAGKEGGIEAASVVSLAKKMQTNQLASKVAGVDAGCSFTFPKSPQREHEIKENFIPKPGANICPEPPIASKASVSITEDVPFMVPDDWKVPGLIVLNPGQLLYSYRLDKAMTKQSWNSQSRKSGIHPIPTVHPAFNKIDGNRTVEEHVQTTFAKIINNPAWVSPKANIYVVGIGNGGDAVLKVLNDNWTLYKDRIAAIALTDPTPIQEPFSDQDFVAFLRHRARALVCSQEPLGTPLAVPCSTDHPEKREHSTSHHSTPWLEKIEDDADSGPLIGLISRASDGLVSAISQLAIDQIQKAPTEPVRTMPDQSNGWGYHYFPMLSSGKRTFGEIIFPMAQSSILAWFETVASTPDYRNPVFQVPKEAPEGLESAEIFDAEKAASGGVLADISN